MIYAEKSFGRLAYEIIGSDQEAARTRLLIGRSVLGLSGKGALPPVSTHLLHLSMAHGARKIFWGHTAVHKTLGRLTEASDAYSLLPGADPIHEEPLVVDRQGLACRVEKNDTRPITEPLSDLTDLMVYRTAGLTESDTVATQFSVVGGYRQGSVELLNSLAHTSVGVLNEQGEFRARASVLNPDHPARLGAMPTQQ